MSTPRDLVIVARVVRQGPQAPFAGDSLALAVYEYEAVEAVEPIGVADGIQVAHRDADLDDPGFAVGRLRRLTLSSEVPTHATLLTASTAVQPPGPVWYCESSEPVPDR